MFASLNSNSLDINEALYLQEERTMENSVINIENVEYMDSIEETTTIQELETIDDDLNEFDWKNAIKSEPTLAEEEHDEKEEDLDSLLGDFLNKMNM